MHWRRACLAPAFGPYLSFPLFMGDQLASIQGHIEIVCCLLIGQSRQFFLASPDCSLIVVVHSFAFVVTVCRFNVGQGYSSWDFSVHSEVGE